MNKFSVLSEIHDKRVLDNEGKPVGFIRDLLLDLDEGRIEYVCIRLDASKRTTHHEVIVPWSSLTTDAITGSDWIVAASHSVLRRMAQPISLVR